MSKFFDFHKVQQQQQQSQQQNQYFNNSSRSDHMNVSNLMENHRLNSQFLDHTLNGELIVQLGSLWHLCRPLRLSKRQCEVKKKV